MSTCSFGDIKSFNYSETTIFQCQRWITESRSRQHENVLNRPHKHGRCRSNRAISFKRLSKCDMLTTWTTTTDNIFNDWSGDRYSNPLSRKCYNQYEDIWNINQSEIINKFPIDSKIITRGSQEPVSFTWL